jgi:hypothetical protein
VRPCSERDEHIEMQVAQLARREPLSGVNPPQQSAAG